MLQKLVLVRKNLHSVSQRLESELGEEKDHTLKAVQEIGQNYPNLIYP